MNGVSYTMTAFHKKASKVYSIIKNNSKKEPRHVSTFPYLPASRKLFPHLPAMQNLLARLINQTTRLSQLAIRLLMSWLDPTPILAITWRPDPADTHDDEDNNDDYHDAVNDDNDNDLDDNNDNNDNENADNDVTINIEEEGEGLQP